MIAHSNATIINSHLGSAKHECATAHQSGKPRGFVNVKRIKAFSIASRLGAIIPNRAMTYPDFLQKEDSSKAREITNAKLKMSKP